jgi:hypothetical protein
MNKGLSEIAQGAVDIKKIIEEFGSIPNTPESINAIEKIAKAPGMISTMASLGQIIITPKTIYP